MLVKKEMPRIKEKIINILEDEKTYTLSEITILSDERRYNVFNFLQKYGAVMNIQTRIKDGEYAFTMKSSGQIRRDLEADISILRSLKNKLDERGELVTEDVMKELGVGRDKANCLLNQLSVKVACQKAVTLTKRRTP